MYNRAYSEDAEQDNKYADKLETMANNILTGIAKGEFILTDYTGPTPGPPPDQPDFFPMDITGSAQTYDGMGNPIGAMGDEDIKFWMGMTK
jgi:hypothetical protein